MKKGLMILMLVLLVVISGCAVEDLYSEQPVDEILDENTTEIVVADAKPETVTKENCNDVILKVNQEISYGDYKVILDEVWDGKISLTVDGVNKEILEGAASDISDLQFEILELFLSSDPSARIAKVHICSENEIEYAAAQPTDDNEADEETSEETNNSEEEASDTSYDDIGDIECNQSFNMREGQLANYDEHEIIIDYLSSADATVIVDGETKIVQVNVETSVNGVTLTVLDVFNVGTSDANTWIKISC